MSAEPAERVLGSATSGAARDERPGAAGSAGAAARLLFLGDVEARLEQAVAFVDGAAGGRGAATLAAGGKRLRPLLVLLSAPRRGRGRGDVQRAAVAVELVHMASLVHDDVLDRASLRRGLPTVWATHGDRVATATGDYLFARAFDVLAETGDSVALAELARCAVGLSEGEALQLLQSRRPETSVDDYLERCDRKTGRLFAAACRLGARLGGAPLAAQAALAGYGHALGLAFQVADDILDCDGSPTRTGKALGTDLLDGTPTLPLILAAQRDASVAAALRRTPRPADVLSILHRVVGSGAIEDARVLARRLAGEAEARLEALDGSFDTPGLRAVVRGVVERDA